jgi:hypothetical protein
MDVIAIVSAAVIFQPKIEVVDDIANSNLIVTWEEKKEEKLEPHRLIAPIHYQFGSMSQVHSDVLEGINFAEASDGSHDCFAGFLMFGAISAVVPKKVSFVSFIKHDNNEHWDKVIADIDGKRLYLPIEIIYSNDLISLREAFAKSIDQTLTAVETTAKMVNKDKEV